MNKAEIKQIILEEIEAVINEMASPEHLAADSRPEDEDDIDGPEYEDMYGADVPPFITPEEYARRKLRYAEKQGKIDSDYIDDLDEMARTSNVFKLSQEASMKDVLQFMQRVNDVLKTYKSPGQKRPKKRFTPEEMKALATAMLKPEGFTSKDVIASTSYNSPAQANKFLKALEMKGLITLTSQLKKSMAPERDPNAPETRGRKRKDSEFDMADDPDMMDFGDFDNLDLSDPLAESAASDLELKSLAKKIIPVIKKYKMPVEYATDSSKYKVKRNTKDVVPAIIHIEDGIMTVAVYLYSLGMVSELDTKPGFGAVAIKGREIAPKMFNDLKAVIPTDEFELRANSKPDEWGNYIIQIRKKATNENKTTMSELEKYIKQQIREAKNPLAKRMKEIENQGRIAALETKLAAIAEMIEETEGRLTRIDEDNEFKEMMDKNAVKEVRKQLKELERAQAKLQKEYDKAAGGRKKEKVVDELDAEETRAKADKFDDLADRQDALDQEAGEVEEVSFELNESVKRMQKLANLKR